MPSLKSLEYARGTSLVNKPRSIRILEASYDREARGEKLKVGLLKAVNNTGLQLTQMNFSSAGGPCVPKKLSIRLINL